MTSEPIVLRAGESATVVVMHSDASMSTVQIKADDTAMMLVILDANPAIPYGLITRESDDEDELHTAAAAPNSNHKQLVARTLAQLADSLQQVAASRQILDAAGAPLPVDVLEGLLDIRQSLRDIGCSDAQIDAAPGLQLAPTLPIWQARSTRLAGEPEAQ